MPRTKKPSRKRVILIVAVVSILLYSLGVLSGLLTSRLIKEDVSSDITELRSGLDNSALDIKNIQLQQLFLDHFENGDCEFLDLYLKSQSSLLDSYWDVLPFRLEEYDKKVQQSDEYSAIKREYIRFSLRYWLLSTENYQKCEDTAVIPILYFYSRDCENCITQGLEFDRFNRNMALLDKTVILFPIDSDFEEDTVYLLRQYYNITEYPSIIIKNGELIEGLTTSQQLVNFYKK